MLATSVFEFYQSIAVQLCQTTLIRWLGTEHHFSTGGSHFGKPAHNFFSHSAVSNNIFLLSVSNLFFTKKFMNFCTKDSFHALKIILWYFDNYMTHCHICSFQSQSIGSLQKCSHYVYINYCSMNKDVQYRSGKSSVQVRMCSTSTVDHQF